MRVWRNCVVSLIDLVGIKMMASGPTDMASKRMRRLHKKVSAEMEWGLCHHAHVYLWNDSVLLLAFQEGANTPEAILRDVDELKWKLEPLGKSYAISVQGKAFPDLGQSPADNNQARTTVIKASSYAMANCFRIEEEIGKKLKKPWYLDSRLARKIHTEQEYSKKKVKLLPGTTKRQVYIYDGYLWAEPNERMHLTRRKRASE